MASVDYEERGALIRNATTPYLVRGLCYSQRYTVRRGDPKIQTRYTHRIMFKDDGFTLDGYNYRRVNDPVNASFLKSLEECGCPDEFEGEGVHRIWIHRRPGDMGWHESEGEFNPSNVYCIDDKGCDKSLKEFKTSNVNCNNDKGLDKSEEEIISSIVNLNDNNDWDRFLGEFGTSNLYYYNEDKDWDDPQRVFITDNYHFSEDDEWVSSCQGYGWLSKTGSMRDVDYTNLFA